MNYGFHRVIEPAGIVPQAAIRLDNKPIIKNPYEILLDVSMLNLDASSMKEIRENYPDIKGKIMEIVKTRGKMHNPVSDSGGVLIGQVKEIGKRYQKWHDLKAGDKIIPLTSLTAIPLHLEEIKRIKGDQVNVKGQAILFSSYPYSRIPEGMGQKMALSAIDISSIVPQVYRNIKDNSTVLIMGCGKAGLIAMSAIRKVAPNCCIIGMDYGKTKLGMAKKLGHANYLIQMDVTKQEKVLENIKELTHGKLCDLVINCTVAKYTETSATLAAKEHGKILHFDTQVNFRNAALSTDATGKDVEMIIGNGIAENQAEETFNLLMEDKKLKRIFGRLS